MNVKNLIDILKNLPKDTDVEILDDSSTTHEPKIVIETIEDKDGDLIVSVVLTREVAFITI